MRILIVEDEKKLAELLKRTLEKESYSIDIALNGKSGCELAYVEDYDLIILDIGLPDRDGLSVSRDLRSDGVKTPILMLTARDATKNKVEGFNSGGDDYLVKPFEFEELLARIRALIRRGKGVPEPVLKAGNLVLNPSTHVVERGGREINLTAKEYSLLEYLILHSNQIISKQRLIDHVWDSSLDPFSNVVDVYIGYLRSKIDRDFPNDPPLIHTIKGLGYKLG